MLESSIDIDYLKKVVQKNYIQTILVLGQLFLKHVPKCIFKLHHISKSTNAIIYNLCHTFP